MENLWFAARTIAHVELNMRIYLQKCNITCFIPTKIQLVKKKNIVLEKEIPYIKNMIFFKTTYSIANSLFSLNKRKIFCIRNKKGLITIPEKEMDGFMAFINYYGKKIMVRNDVNTVGDRVKIKSGPFAGVDGTVIQIGRNSYFTLALGELLTVLVRFPKSNLIKI